MNWPLNVKGAKVLDLMADGVEPRVLAKILKKSNQAISLIYQRFGLNKLLRLPPVDDPRNIIDCTLASSYHQDYVNAFFESASLEKPEQVQVVGIPFYRVLTRANSTVAFTFTYDPEIKWV